MTSDAIGNTEASNDVKRERRAARQQRVMQLTVRRRNAVELAIAGATYDEIAETLGYSSRANAWRDVRKALAAVTAAPADELRELELRRLDKLQASHWVAAQSDPKRANIVLKIMERRHRLLGLDAPQKVDLSAWLRDAAERYGLPYDFAVEAANDIIQRSGF